MDVNKIKRQSSLNESLDIDAKKLRTITHEKKSITSIEDLSNEIFYEIFDYLDGYKIYQAFFDLNFRIQQLITCSSFRLKISFSEKSRSEIKHCCTHVMFPNRHQILSLSFWNSSLIDDVFKQCIIDSSFDRLESIRIWEISTEKLLTFLFYLNSLPRLFSLIIYLESNDFYDLSEIYRIIFYIPCLKYSCVSILEEAEVNTLLPMAINERFSTIEYLVMNHNCTLNELILMLYHTPQLRHLTCGKLLEFDDNVHSDVALTLPHLTYIRIYECFVEFDEFEKFLKKICRQLKVLRIDEFRNTNFIYPDRWEQLILQEMPHLLQFQFSHYLHVDEISEDFHAEKYINQITSRFWIDHGWIFKLFIDSKETCCNIYPYKKSWFNLDQYTKTIACSNQDSSFNQQTTNQSSLHFRQNIEFEIIPRVFENWNPSFMDKLHSMLLAIQFNSLNMVGTEMPTYAFLNLVHLLPNLDLLKVWSSSFPELSKLSNEDADNLRLASKSNKITKVWQSMNMNLTEFLITLCPRIEHFEIVSIIDEDLERLVQFILTKTVTHIPHLHSLQLSSLNINDEIVDKLQKMINSEHLLSNYNIQRSGNKITLKWK